MEIIEQKPAWLNPEHPNYKRWLRGREFSNARARIVSEIVSAYKKCENLDILDLGSGEGGTSSYLAESNNVISYDLSLLRLKRQEHQNKKFKTINGKAESLPFHNSTFDLIMLQDVIEHVSDRDSLICELKRVLKSNGLIYLSTPNKFSLFNIISDPHWGIPFLSLFKRKTIKKYFLRFFRKEDFNRIDISELPSLKALNQLFEDFSLHLNTRKITELLKEDYRGILWSSFHRSIYVLLKKTKLIFTLNKIANDKAGFVNNILTPTFYLIMIPGKH